MKTYTMLEYNELHGIVLKPGAFYWVMPTYDVDSGVSIDEWPNTIQPARFSGYDEHGQELWDYIGSDGPMDWPPRWRGQEIEAPE